MRARMAIKLADIKCEIREVKLNNKPEAHGLSKRHGSGINSR